MKQPVQRRLAAILAADVAGYSRLIGADEGGTLQEFNAIKVELFDPAIAAHNGRLVKTTGDGFLVEFSSVVDALHCATEIQAHMAERNVAVPTGKRLDFRIGINVGDIVVEGGDIFGDGVNVAVRLEGLADPGGICVSARVQEDATGKLGLAFEDLGEQRLKNIARPARVYRVLAGAATSWRDRAPLPLPNKPSIAVSPFANMSGDPEQDYFVDGTVEEIITALSRYPSLFVIARNSSFTFKGRAINVTQVGHELGVRYVLEGAIRKAGSRIRVTAQLVEAEGGNHVWAERYDRNLADIFMVQDEITEAVTTAIAPAIADAERRTAMRKQPNNLDAWGAYQRGLWHVSKFSSEDNTLAQQFFRQAIELDPSFSGGYGGLAVAHTQAAGIYQTYKPNEMIRAAEGWARRAIEVDPNDAESHGYHSNALWMLGDHESAVAAAERALALSPNLARGHANLGCALIFSGRAKEGVAALQKSIKLDPYEPMLPSRLNLLAIGHYFAGDYDATVETAKRTIRASPHYPLPYRWLAAALGQLDRLAEAKQALETAISIAPNVFDRFVRGRVPWHRPEDHAHMIEGLRKAGWEGG